LKTEAEILEVVRIFLKKHLQIHPDEITRESRMDELEMDSLDSVTMIVEIENFIRKGIDAEILEECERVGDLLDHCLKLQNA
jgi:acyl carrier protein